jgi:malate synthase
MNTISEQAVKGGAMAEIVGYDVERGHEVLTPEALAFVADLERTFGGRRRELVARRTARQAKLAAGEWPLTFLEETADVRDTDWRVAEAPADLRDRRTEITGPTNRKMAINALNSGARVWLADHEDANTPTWTNMVEGQVTLRDATRGSLTYVSPDGKEYAVTAERPATIVMRPRGWHLEERHVLVDGAPVTAALFDFGLYFFHNARQLLDTGSGPYFYLPKLESHLEARLWNDVFAHAEAQLAIPTGSVRATVLIETLPAAFEMDEILYELRTYASGLNAGRWDYLFSIIKTLRECGPEYVLPDRNSVTMTAPFMRAYTDLLVQTCHRRGAHAIGGMAAFIPNRREQTVTMQALRKVREDKEREASDGFDGSWVAHPDLVPICTEVFDAVLGRCPNQIETQRDEVKVLPDELVDVRSAGGAATRAGLDSNVRVSLRYLEAWLGGNGAVGLFNLMEDVATAEIARSQLWQWARNGTKLAEGTVVTPRVIRDAIDAEARAIEWELGPETYRRGRWTEVRDLLVRLTTEAAYSDFLTLHAYSLVD